MASSDNLDFQASMALFARPSWMHFKRWERII